MRNMELVIGMIGLIITVVSTNLEKISPWFLIGNFIGGGMVGWATQ